jgi:hypothetical protein
MLKKNILSGPIIYVSLAHRKNHIYKYLDNFEEILIRMKKLSYNLINYIDKDDLNFTEIKRYN